MHEVRYSYAARSRIHSADRVPFSTVSATEGRKARACEAALAGVDVNAEIT